MSETFGWFVQVLTPADETHHINKHNFKVPFVCGCRDLGEALRRIAEGAAMIRTKVRCSLARWSTSPVCGSEQPCKHRSTLALHAKHLQRHQAIQDESYLSASVFQLATSIILT